MDPSTKIISHMNGQHQLASVDYLVVYGHVDLSQLAENSAKITAVDDKSFDISYDLKSSPNHKITLKWDEIEDGEGVVVSSMKDIKAKLVAMAKYAANKQGFSHVQITDYPPLSKETALFASLSVIFLIGSYDLNWLKRLLKQNPIFSTLTPFLPGFLWKVLDFSGRNIRTISAGMYIIHVIEILLTTGPALRKYRFPPAQRVAWLFVHFLEGFYSIIKMNKLIESKSH
ncbi:hypothetical protein PSN45_002523 [Yamadazyma tenuis]|uniref:DUF2470 domain-containing protein n=1 Tax=Candida tenuis (strain ATCC 10573 / BCRC 21748 / CBS 615 / JCM 9827 / NBRC 10315 / NRRL Y-1498 / VKM Y-70) TaxID=590646 RepID=G3B065_CANTC|nr:uncharacterized protein CANTEDRAFT_119572 [Yamadazyma tenuis ATCC 10573]XP_006685015.1 uncharacterized protein CANTEDRAFT_119572 [Yamadazyma tenuis ATCC 10573]EGV65328.1 hypothetical protein CANTEDRAFT_119572 [Yamadazyma tenuis ATCC 10573]EGV65329.1 hypothetical protein CANTEDRAFT_119572 [Yamadazyma tenuis ATCC 10573]WEJ95015.1 hypothetical protein PSN45_002523 [Yamadazyma tenuis]